MDFTVCYTMDDVGYCQTMSGANEEKVKETCLEELKGLYPLSTCTVTSIEKVEKVEKVKKSKEEKP